MDNLRLFVRLLKYLLCEICMLTIIIIIVYKKLKSVGGLHVKSMYR